MGAKLAWPMPDTVCLTPLEAAVLADDVGSTQPIEVILKFWGGGGYFFLTCCLTGTCSLMFKNPLLAPRSTRGKPLGRFYCGEAFILQNLGFRPFYFSS